MVEWSQCTSDELKRLDRRLPVIVPMGLQESHGAHLPNGTDTLTVEYVVRAAAVPLDCIVCPTVNYGYGGSSYEYPGTLGIGLETLAGVIVDIVTAVRRHGFTKILFISGHGGNSTPYEVAMARLAHICPDVRCAYHNWWTLAGYKDVHHADAFESETAAAMGIRFERSCAVDCVIEKTWYTEFSRAARYPDTGATNGRPSDADIERGRAEVKTVIKALQALIRRVHED